MFGLDTKSLLIGLAVGYLVAPRVVSFVAGKVATSGGDAA